MYSAFFTFFYQNHCILFSFLWLGVGVAVIAVIGLLYYLYREIRKDLTNDIIVVAKPMDEKLKYELGRHKEAVNQLTQVIEETRTDYGDKYLRNHTI